MVSHPLRRLVVIATLFALFVPALRADDSPYYVVFKTWGLATPETETGLKAVSFLPRRYLLYIDDRQAPVSMFGTNYLRAVTQDGVEVFVDPGSVSRGTFRESIGTHEVIFNTEYLLCREVDCDPSDFTAWPIDRGDAFHIVEERNGVYVLEGRREEPFRGHIAVETLRGMKRRGQVTRVDDPHPRYRIEKRRAPALRTGCGEQRTVGDLHDLAQGDQGTRAVLRLLQIAEVQGNRIEVKRNYGETDRMYEFFSYRIEDHEAPEDSSDRFFEVATAFKYHCRPRDLAEPVKDYIELVTLASSRRADQIEITIDDFGTPKDLLDLTGSPYMISINKPAHFFRALEILSQRIEDRTLAGYAITELNRSCRSTERASNPKCLGYDY